MGNPLVAEAEETKSFEGIPLLESVDDTKKAIEKGDWAGTVLGAVGTGLDAAVMAMDPIGSILAAGVGWLIEHVEPLTEALNALTGDDGEIKAHSKTWTNVANELGEINAEMANLVKNDTAGWTGKAGDAYRKRTEETATLIEAAKKAAEGAADGISKAGMAVSAVRTLVRDIIAELVGHLISWALQVLATAGIGMAWVLPQVVAAVAKVATQIADITGKLVKAMKALAPLLKSLGDSFGKAGDLLKKIKADNAPAPKPKPQPKPDTRSPDGKGPDPNSSQGSGGGKGPDPNTSQGADGGNGPAPNTSQSADGGNGPAPSTSQGAETPPPRSGDQPPPDQSRSATPEPGGGSTPPPRTGSQGSSGGGSQGKPNIRDNNRGPDKERTPDKNKNTCGDPIDVASGDVVLPQTDVELAGVLPLVLRRLHLSSYRAGWSFGSNWASTVDQRLEVDEAGVSFAGDDGTLLFYPHPAPESLPQAGPRKPLALTDEGYTITVAEEGWTLHFGSGSAVLPLRAITDRNGHRIEFDRDEAGVPTEIRHSGGYRIRVESADGLITALHLCGADGGADLPLVRFGYQGGRLAEVINASGVPLRFTYDDAGRITSWTDRNGTWYRYGYDHEGRVVRADGSGGFFSGTMSYEDGVTRWTNSLGQQTAYHLDERGRTVREVDPAGNEVRSEWDEFDRPLTRTDPLGRVMRYEYDEAGNLLAVSRPDGSQTRFEYNDRGLPVTVVAPDGTVSRQEYDERGNLTRVIDPAGAVTTYGYDEHGNLSTITDALGGVRTVETDAAGLPVSVTDATGATTRYERDGFGRTSVVVDPLGGVTRFGWTVDGAPAWRTLPDGTTEKWAYDGEGNLRTHVDPLGQVTRTEVTHFDLPIAEVRPNGTRLEFGYDTELRLTSVTNQQGLVWRYEYDTVGNLVRETDFNGRMVTYRHDAAGQLIERTNGEGETTRFTHDVFGNVVERRSGGKTSTFTYDALGRLVEATNPEAQVAFRRDPAGRVLAETVNGRTIASVYDPLGRRVRRRTPSGAESVWDYDASSRPVALHTAGRTLRFDYDSAGNEIQRHLGSDAVLSQSWDANHKLLSQTLTGAAGGRVQERSYTYRADGFLSAMDDRLTGPRTFDLDRTGRVTAVSGSGWTERYAYDAAGNIANASWPTPSGADVDEIGDREYSGTLIRRAGKVRYEHDAQGRVVLRQRKRLSQRPETWRYLWDADDQLSEVLTPDGARWRYRYDPLGRRIAKQRLTPDGSRILEQVEFVWDGLVMAEQAHTDGLPNGPGLGDARVTVWDYEPGTSRPLTQTERSPLSNAPQQWIDEQFYSIVTDLVGTPTELIDDKGDIAWFHRTTLWGATIDQSGGGAGTPLRFPGQYHDPETGFNYNFHRHYDPVSGRYSSADPIGLEGGTNPHQYVPNPHTWLDPLGLTPTQCIKERIAEDSRLRADIYHGMVDDEWTRNRSTYAIISALDQGGNSRTVVGASSVGFNQRQLDLARRVGDDVAPGSGHAEMNALAYIRSQGWSPQAGGASRNVCVDCGRSLFQNGGAELRGPEHIYGKGTGERLFTWGP
ncbi:RHS repeat-associated core domain-containing protein [Saccharopolyspora taberi]|uniref:RHS repeat-associated core domain-containing protein n=1 Tax=Saccharopolyspora taberi TaxID=60895 RepID=A0ABN3VAY8_9PSEU